MASELRRIPRPLCVAALVFGVIVFAVSAWHWWTFQYRTFDLAFYVQGLWLALRGKWHVSMLGVSLMGNHVEPLVFLITPLFAICPHPLLLVGVQTAALATMPLTAWRIARRLGIEERPAFWLALATILMPATGFVGLHEFHPEAFAAPLVLLLIEARLAGRLGWFWVWFTAVLACKENMALLLVAWGAVHALWDWRRSPREQWRWNLAPLLVAVAWFVACTRFITPALNAGKVDYLELYSHLGRSGGEIVTGFFRQPQIAPSALWQAVTQGNLVWGLLVPLLALPLLRPRWLLIGAPILFQHLLSWRSSEWMLNFHYAAPLVPLAWMAAAEFVAGSKYSLPLARAIALACAAGQLAFGPVSHILVEVPKLRAALWERKWKAQMLAKIPANASVTAGLPYLSHLAKREEAHSLHHILKGLNTLSRARYSPPPPTDCVVIDYEDDATFDTSSGYYHPAMRTTAGEIVPSSDRLLHEFLRHATWTATSVNAVTVLTHGTASRNARLPASDPVTLDAVTTLQGVNWDSLQASVQLSRTPASQIEGTEPLLLLEWQFSSERVTFPWLTLLLKGDAGEFLISRGLCAIQANSGSATETWTILAPPAIPPGRYRVRAFFTNRASTEPTPHVFHASELGEATIGK
jgi:uncharacterized membrane protein